MLLFPPSKINLGLNVLFKRDDGYHEMESCLYPIPLFDVLEIVPAEVFSFTAYGLPIDGSMESNLVVKAYQLMQENYGVGPVAIYLRKNIPMGAGLGGGSADATYCLRGLNALFELDLSQDQLRELSARLGSDCPFFVEDQAQLAQGRGERLSPLDIQLNGYYLKLVNPGIHVGTAEAYDSIQFSQQSNLLAILEQPIGTWRDHLVNAFEPSIFKKHPEIATRKQSMYDEGAIYAAMSGSGSSVFGIFEHEPKLTHAHYFEKIVVL